MLRTPIRSANSHPLARSWMLCCYTRIHQPNMLPIGSTALTHRRCLFRFSLRLQRFLCHRLRRSRSTMAFASKVERVVLHALEKRIQLWPPSCYGVGRGAGVGRGRGVTLGLGAGVGVIVGVAVAVAVAVALGAVVGVAVDVAVAVAVGVGGGVEVGVGHGTFTQPT